MKPHIRIARLVVDPERRFAFTWNAPPSIPSIRGRRTVVMLDFAAAGEKATRLRFTHLGWGEGPDWPIDWDARPDLAPIQPTLMRTLAAGDP